MSSERQNSLKASALQAASALREEQHLTLLSPVSIDQIIRDKNIQTLFRPMGEDSSGMAIRCQNTEGDVCRFMMINTDSATGHQRFTACHEFYHLLYQEDFNCVSEQTARFSTRDPEEFKADWFASFLILPYGALQRLVPVEEQKKDAITLATLLAVEQRFQCSRQTVLFRLKDLGWIGNEKYTEYSINVIRSASLYGYPANLYKSTGTTSFIGDYNIKARQLFDQGTISMAKYSDLLEVIGIDLTKEAIEDGEI